ncbi:DUF4197 domain-containing protein [Algoriphagus sp. SE2]|uniref:DUF4197 domain-containing protein n=1 Tax=Algoriphagus sp. SE2 TaxID=3141536 RepID=UPI0031CD9D67
MQISKSVDLTQLYRILLFFVLSLTSTSLLAQNIFKPSNEQLNAGLKEALALATEISADRLHQKDGYLNNLDVKILFPPEAKNIENTLRSLGLGSMVDQVIVSVNRAAEDAAIQAKPIFESAIKEMSIQDVKTILTGEKDAATQYFAKSTSDSLAVKFEPIIDQSLKKVDATNYWEDVTTRYNKVPFVKKVNTDLTGYVTKKAIDGLFIEIAKEELKIRENINARKSELLKQVFGSVDKAKE